MGPDSAGQLLRFFFIRIRNNVRIVLERDLRITMAHELRYDVNRRSGFEQTCRYPVRGSSGRRCARPSVWLSRGGPLPDARRI